MKWLTTPPPMRPPDPKHPMFTTKFFSTKSWGPGHIVGAGILAVGTYAVAKLFIARGQEEAERARARQHPSGSPEVAQTGQPENARGQYGKKP